MSLSYPIQFVSPLFDVVVLGSFPQAALGSGYIEDHTGQYPIQLLDDLVNRLGSDSSLRNHFLSQTSAITSLSIPWRDHPQSSGW